MAGAACRAEKQVLTPGITRMAGRSARPTMDGDARCRINCTEAEPWEGCAMIRMGRCRGLGMAVLPGLGWVIVACAGSVPAGQVVLPPGMAASGTWGHPAVGTVEAVGQAAGWEEHLGAPPTVSEDEDDRDGRAVPTTMPTSPAPAPARLAHDVLGPSVDLDPLPLRRDAPVSRTPTDR